MIPPASTTLQPVLGQPLRAKLPSMATISAVEQEAGPIETATQRAALHRAASASPSEKQGFKASALVPWASFLGLGALGIAQPEVVLPITALVATNFPARFVGQDTVGMALPRISVSLERGATPYDPAEDPEAQKRHGLSKTVYVAKQRLSHANFSNLQEEMMREMASAPMVLIISTIGFTSLKPLSRILGGQPLVARRAIELPYKDINAFSQALKATASPPPSAAETPERTKAWAKSFFTNLMADEKDTKGQSLLDKPFTVTQNLRHTVSDLEYNLPDSYINHLKTANVDGLATELAKFTPQSPISFSAKTADPVVTRTTTLRQVVDQWANAMADHVVLELDGTKANLLSTEARTQNHQAQAKLNYFTRMLDEGVQALNRERPATHGHQLTQWAINMGTGDGPENKVIGGRTGLLRHMDKFRDFVVAVARKTSPSPDTPNAVATALPPLTGEGFNTLVDGLRDRLVTEKLGLVTVFTLANCAFAWWLSHAIQNGREYPANAQVSLSKSAVGNVATANTPGGSARRPASTEPISPGSTSQYSAPLMPASTAYGLNSSSASPSTTDSPFRVREFPSTMATASATTSLFGPSQVFTPLPPPVVGRVPSGSTAGIFSQGATV